MLPLPRAAVGHTWDKVPGNENVQKQHFRVIVLEIPIAALGTHEAERWGINK